MARSDLLLSLVKAGTSGDTRGFRRTIEALIAEERAKQHNVLADSLEQLITTNGSRSQLDQRSTVQAVSEREARGREFVSEIIPRRQLEELHLPLGVRKVVSEFAEEHQRGDVLRAHGLEPRNRVLLVGAPGTGKTVLVEAIAERISVPMFVVRYESMIGSYLGETASRLKRVFDYARTTPCVLFFDEFDALGKERGDVHETGEIKRVVTSLLMQVDDVPSYTIIAAATNHPELLDRAVWRRFQVRFALPMPDASTVARFIQERLGQQSTSAGHTAAQIANSLGPVSFAEAEQFCLDVLRRSILAMGDRSTKSIISEQLDAWHIRSLAQNSFTKTGSHGRAPASRATKR